ncbi:MAG: trypsin-like peptidase domain-containing protein [Myxococcota bacterium]
MRTLRPLLGLLGLALPLAALAAPEAALEERIITVSEQVKPSVVFVQAIVRVNDRKSEVTGSGVIASADGLVLTNHHVVERAEKVEVSVPGRKQPYRAEVLGTDKQTDLAVLRIQPGEPLAVARFGQIDDVRVGQWVLAIGNPYGLDGTVSLGIVSAKGRNLEIPHLLNDFIQTDAMIDRGSSGGPLVDLEGRVIGINSRGQGRGIGFTIPVDTVLEVLAQISNGGVERGWLGVSIQPLDRDLAAHLGIPSATGVIVNSVAEGSPAAKAGLRAGDVLTDFAGRSVEAEKEEDLGDFQRRVARTEPGAEVRLGLLRDRKAKTARVTLAAQPKVEPAEADSDFGYQVLEITENLFRSERLATREGAYVSFVAGGSPAAEAGLARGDVVVRIGDRRIESLDDFRSATRAAEGEERVLVQARRGDDLRFLLLKRGGRRTEPSAPASRPEDAALEAPSER